MNYGIDPKHEGSIMCRICQRQIQRCICDGPNDAPLDTGPNAPLDRALRAANLLNRTFNSESPPGGDGVALTSMAHPEGLIEKMAEAIKDGRLSLTKKLS
jgi:hypothetical protein